MNTLMVGQMENATQASIVTLFQQRLGYRCLGRWGDRDNSNIEQPCSMLAGQALRNLRTKRKWTQTDLALRADVDRNYV